MKKFFNLYMILGCASLFLFLLLIILLNFDKGIITENNKEVGLSTFNNMIKYEENTRYHNLSSVMLYMSLAFIAVLAIYGLYQLLRERSLSMVDKDLIVIGIFMVIAVIIWLLFDKVVKINYRPIGELEGSFPSTHVTMVTFLSLVMHHQICKYKEDSKLYKYLTLAISLIMIVITFLGRIFAGKHYITDAIGGLFIGLALYFICYGVIKFIELRKESNNEL